MANEKAFYVRNGDRLDYPCTAAVAVGDVIKLPGGLIGIAEAAGAEGDVIALTMVGVFAFQTDGGAIDQGAAVYLTAEGKASATAAGNTFIGTAWSGATASDAAVLVKINTGVASAAE